MPAYKLGVCVYVYVCVCVCVCVCVENAAGNNSADGPSADGPSAGESPKKNAGLSLAWNNPVTWKRPIPRAKGAGKTAGAKL